MKPNKRCRIRLTVFAQILLTLLILTTAATAGHLHRESWYQERWCKACGGQVEVVLPDRTRCDCLTDDYAIEVDFAEKWAEAIGQSLYYSFQTGKRAGIALILESESDRKNWIRLNSTIQHFNLQIKTWEIKN